MRKCSLAPSGNFPCLQLSNWNDGESVREIVCINKSKSGSLIILFAYKIFRFR